MRFDDYLLIESKDVFKALSKVKTDCQPWIKNAMAKAKPTNRLVYRGMDTSEVIIKKKVRKNRRPKDSHIYSHKLANDWFKVNFGWRPRSESVFVNPYYPDVTGYGNKRFAIFPIGRFKYIWSPKIFDMVHMLGQTFGLDDIMDYEEFKRSDFAEKIIKNIDQAGYTDKNIGKALEKDAEIMIGCDYYYGIEVQYLLNSFVSINTRGTLKYKELSKNISEYLMS